MSVSGDYDLNSVEAFKDAFGDLLQIVDTDTVVKTVNVMIKFQTRHPSTFWGETLTQRASIIEKTYPYNQSNMPSDAELLANLKATLEKSNAHSASKLELNGIKEAMELLSIIEPDKYPTLLTGLYEIAREIDDENLFALIKMYQLMLTSPLPDENPEKIQATSLSNLPLKSPTVQALLLSIRQKLNESTPIDLFRQARTYLLNIAPVMTQFLESEIKKAKEQEETLQLPLDSEKVQQLIAPLRDKIRQKNQEEELAKVISCYKQAVWQMKATSGEKQFSSIETKVVYAKRSNLDQDFVYEKKYFPIP